MTASMQIANNHAKIVSLLHKQYHCLFNLLSAENGICHSETLFFSVFNVLFSNVNQMKLKSEVIIIIIIIIIICVHNWPCCC
jgi:hypothetical protein